MQCERTVRNDWVLAVLVCGDVGFEPEPEIESLPPNRKPWVTRATRGELLQNDVQPQGYPVLQIFASSSPAFVFAAGEGERNEETDCLPGASEAIATALRNNTQSDGRREIFFVPCSVVRGHV